MPGSDILAAPVFGLGATMEESSALAALAVSASSAGLGVVLEF